MVFNLEIHVITWIATHLPTQIGWRLSWPGKGGGSTCEEGEAKEEICRIGLYAPVIILQKFTVCSLCSVVHES